MGHIFSELFLFLGSVFSHWQIWLSGGGLGGFIVIAVALVEKLWGKSLSKRVHVYLFLVAFFLCACFLSWVDKDDALKSERDTYTTDSNQWRSNYATLQSNCNNLSSQLQYKSGVVDTLGNQNRDQQNTINKCQSEALQLIAPKDLKVQAYPIDPKTESNSPGMVTMRVLLLVNKPISPVTITISCDGAVRDFNVIPLTHTNRAFTTESNSRNNADSMTADISSPTITPDSPFIIQLTRADAANSCNFDVH